MKKLSLFVCCMLVFAFFIPIMPANDVCAVTDVSEEINLLPNGDFNDVDTEESVVWGETIKTYTAKGWDVQNGSTELNGEKDFRIQIKKKKSATITSDTLYFFAGEYKISADIQCEQAYSYPKFKLASKNVSDCVADADGIINVSESGLYTFQINATAPTNKSLFIDDVVLYDTEKTSIVTESGAYVRTAQGNAGLRFKGKVNKALFDGYVNNPECTEVTAGMIIAPTDFLSDCAFTVSALNLNEKAVQKCNASIVAEKDGYYTFNCAIVGILSQNIDRPFSARSFISFKIGDTTYYLYGNYSENNNSRSVYEIACLAREEIESFEDYQQDIINGFCNAIEDPT